MIICAEKVLVGASSAWRLPHRRQANSLKPQDDKGYGDKPIRRFYLCQQGCLRSDGDGYVDLCGGFHDAGDHVQFGLPQSYSGSTLDGVIMNLISLH